jgi:hypothetical protein
VKIERIEKTGKNLAHVNEDRHFESGFVELIG